MQDTTESHGGCVGEVTNYFKVFRKVANGHVGYVHEIFLFHDDESDCLEAAYQAARACAKAHSFPGGILPDPAISVWARPKSRRRRTLVIGQTRNGGSS